MERPTISQRVHAMSGPMWIENCRTVAGPPPTLHFLRLGPGDCRQPNVAKDVDTGPTPARGVSEAWQWGGKQIGTLPHAARRVAEIVVVPRGSRLSPLMQYTHSPTTHTRSGRDERRESSS